MSLNDDAQEELAVNTANEVNDTPAVKTKKQTNSLSKISILISASAIVISGYMFFLTQEKSNEIKNNTASYNNVIGQLNSLNSQLNSNDHLLRSLDSQTMSQTSSVKSLQSQINNIGMQVNVPTKDLYKQISIANIQSAISYFVLAKDVALFSGDITKSNSLVDTAFDKVEASRLATVSANERRNIKNDVKQYASKQDVVGQFMDIQSQFSGLRYLTAESSPKKTVKDDNYMSFLWSLVEVQSIPESQVLVATNQDKLFVSEALYNSLISLQRAMYTNDSTSIKVYKNHLQKIIHKYFVQNAAAIKLNKSLDLLQAQSSINLRNSLDTVIVSLSAQQNKLLSNETNTVSSLSSIRDGK